MLHTAEEAQLTPSHQIYFAGCNLRCQYCTVSEWNEQPLAVDEIDVAGILAAIERRKQQGARNINLLGGEPTISLPGILDLVGRLGRRSQVVLNSNMYYNVCVDTLLRGFVDIVLADLKCGDRHCAEALLDAGDYVEVARRNIQLASEHAEVIIRHLLLPGHAECCLKPTLGWIGAEMPGAKVSLRTNYVPPVTAEAAPLDYLDRAEIGVAIDYARDLGLRLIE